MYHIGIVFLQFQRSIEATFYLHRESVKDLQDMAYEVIREYANEVNSSNREEYNKKKKRKKGGELWQSGMIGVVHTFGRSLIFNPHVHALIPEIKIRGKEIKEMAYLDYKYLRRVWQYKLINYMISKNHEKKAEYLKMFKKYLEGFSDNARCDPTGFEENIGKEDHVRRIGRNGPCRKNRERDNPFRPVSIRSEKSLPLLPVR